MRFTKRQGLSVLCFALVFISLFLTAEKLLFADQCFSDTWTRIREEKTVPKMLIMGNSHAFCSFVPEILNDALDTDAAILASSGLGGAGVTDSFEAVLRVGAPEVLVVEVNAYFQPYDEAAQFHKATTLSNINGMPHLWQRVKSTWHEIGFENIPQGAFQLLRSDLMWLRWNGSPEIDYAADGSSLLHYRVSGSYDPVSVQAQARALAQQQHAPIHDPRNEREFRRLMALAQRHGVRVVLVKAPTATAHQELSAMFASFASMAGEYGETLLGAHDFHTDIADLGLGIEDFYDAGHLSRSGAARLTAAFARWLGGLTGMDADFDRCFAYGGERIAPAGDGLWRYSMEVIGSGAECRFIRTATNEVLRDWSAETSALLPIPPESADQVTVEFRRGDQRFSYAFMTANSHVFR